MSFNNLKDSEAERLALLLEELGECQQAIGKILRHGYESYDPTEKVPEHLKPTTNRSMLEKELGDVLHAVDRMSFSSDVKFDRITEHADAKIPKAEKYLHHQHGTGYFKARQSNREATQSTPESQIK